MAWVHKYPVDNTVEGDNEGLGALEASYHERQDGQTLVALFATLGKTVKPRSTMNKVRLVTFRRTRRSGGF